jgi:hypothetical protein
MRHLSPSQSIFSALVIQQQQITSINQIVVAIYLHAFPAFLLTPEPTRIELVGAKAEYSDWRSLFADDLGQTTTVSSK